MKLQNFFPAKGIMRDRTVSLLYTLLLLGATIHPSVALSDTQYAAGLEAYRSHNYQAAASCFERCTSEKSSTALMWLYLGNSYSGSGDRNRAKQVYYALIQKFPNSAESTAAKQYLRQLETVKTSVSKPSVGDTVKPTTDASSNKLRFEDRIYLSRPRADHPAVSMPTRMTIRNAILGLPAHLYKILDDGGVVISLAPNTDDVRRGSGDRDKPGTDETMGEEGGRTFGREIHIYERPKAKDSYDLGEIRSTPELLHIFYHEIGHALDDCLGNYSNDPKLKEIFREDLKQMPPDVKSYISYCTVPVEGCAEIVGGLLGGTNWSTPVVRKYCPRTEKWLKEKLGL
jgi:tetratricopeptide (TPR) repeat protein